MSKSSTVMTTGYHHSANGNGQRLPTKHFRGYFEVCMGHLNRKLPKALTRIKRIKKSKTSRAKTSFAFERGIRYAPTAFSISLKINT
jgi:hypothetical protein